jgi:hypothetical protein
VATVDVEIPEQMLAPERGTLTVTGGEAGANDRQRLVRAATRGTVEVVATYTPTTGGTPVVRRVFVHVASFTLRVDGATQVGGADSTTFAATNDATQQVKVTVELDPVPFCVPTSLVTWSGGAALDDPLRRGVPRASTGRTTVSATIAGATRSVTIAIVELRLDVSGAERVAPGENTFMAGSHPDEVVTLTAKLTPPFPEPTPADLVSWTGGSAAADPLQRIVAKSVIGTTTVLAQVGAAQQSATITINSFTLRVEGATQLGGPDSTTFVATRDASQTATVIADIDPLPSPLPPNFIRWTGGTAVAGDPLRRTVSRASTAPITVSAKVGGTTRSVTIRVVNFSLSVRGATRIGGADSTTFAAAEVAGQVVTVVANITPPLPAPVPADLISWTGGDEVAGNPLRRTVSRAAATPTPTTVSAQFAGATQSVSITIFAFSLRVDGATQLGDSTSTRFIAEQSRTDVIDIHVVLSPSVSLPRNTVTWSGGRATSDQLQRTVSRATAAPSTIRATIGGATRTVTISVVQLQMINQSNRPIPTTGNNACLMVSKFVTDNNLPNTATFAGPPGAAPDPDTFRIQLNGLANGETPTIRLIVQSGATTSYTQIFAMAQGGTASNPVFRTDEHVRLVSNAVDDAHLAHQTPLVLLEDIVRATLVIGTQDITTIELPVGRPPAENGPKAIRTVDINFITLQGIPSDPAATIARMSRNWAQLAIRFNLASSQTVTPVTNVLTVDGTASANGQLSVDVTPSGGALVNVVVPIRRGDSDRQIAQKVAAAISTNAGLTATHHRHDNIFIVLVNKGQDVTFTAINSTVPSVLFQVPALNFTDDISLLEGSVLGLNFSDTNRSTIDIITVGTVTILGTLAGATGGDFLLTNLPGWHNLCIMRQECAQADATAGAFIFIAGHEMGHALFDGSNNLHSPLNTNIFRATVSANDTINAAKRLTGTQNTRARQRSGPTTTPPLLLKK